MVDFRGHYARRESQFLGRLIRSPGSLRRREGSGVLKEEKRINFYFLQSFVFSSVAQSPLTLCNPMGCSTPGFPVHHQLPELAQTHAHCLGDAIQPSHPPLSPSPLTFNLSQHQGLFQ